MHADRQLTGSEPSGIEYLQHKYGHNFAAVSIPLYCTVIVINNVKKNVGKETGIFHTNYSNYKNLFFTPPSPNCCC